MRCLVYFSQPIESLWSDRVNICGELIALVVGEDVLLMVLCYQLIGSDGSVHSIRAGDLRVCGGVC